MKTSYRIVYKYNSYIIQKVQHHSWGLHFEDLFYYKNLKSAIEKLYKETNHEIMIAVTDAI